LREKDHLEDPGLNGDDIKMTLQEVGLGAWIGLIGLRVWTGGGY
jgi:hypothetical protein